MMHDIIQLLPDHISNQIAAGEVIQRPASAVKELIENSIDAKATKISLIVKEAGKALIQVIDNGTGMSMTDARLCFEKHATSKIRTIDDLFKIHSNGFRGEALASIAAVAQVEMKTKRDIDEYGTKIVIENSQVTSQEPTSMASGTHFSMKNLFYNVPARRNFLKTDPQEMSLIIAEFSRLAIAYPEIEFSLYHNENELYRLLPASNLRRICDIFGKSYNDKFVPIEEAADILKISGFVCKPNAANSKSKGKQYLYVNKRFIKSQYIQHAIYSAFKELIQPGDYPYYVIFIDIDPKLIDINVHPTKQEIKFEDEQLVYGFINATIRRSLMQFNLAPSIDFSIDSIFHNMDAVARPNTLKNEIEITNTSSASNGRVGLTFGKQNEKNWEAIFSQSLQDEYYTGEIKDVNRNAPLPTNLGFARAPIEIVGKPTQILNKYIVLPANIGLLLLDQRRAHERILYDEMLRLSLKEKITSQRLLFPICIDFSIQDSFVLEEIMNDLLHLGFDISPMGNQVFAIQGIPADLPSGNEKELLIELVENFKNNFKAKNSKKEAILISICKISSVKRSQTLSEEEVGYLSQNIFQRENYHTTPGGKPIFYTLPYQDIEKYFHE
jgi:DNA mismatch repair protein MutL